MRFTPLSLHFVASPWCRRERTRIVQPSFKEAEMENTQATKHRNKGLLFPLMLILVGTVILLERNGLIDRQTILQLMPLAPIAVGCTLLLARLRRRMR